MNDNKKRMSYLALNYINYLLEVKTKPSDECKGKAPYKKEMR